MTGQNLKYLLALLNSSLLSWYFPFISTDVRGKTRRYIRQYVENFPIARELEEKQRPFELIVDCILFAKENDLEIEAETLETIIDSMVFDLYFEDEMRENNCYLSDRIATLITPLNKKDTHQSKINHIKKLHRLLTTDTTIDNAQKIKNKLDTVKIINNS